MISFILFLFFYQAKSLEDKSCFSHKFHSKRLTKPLKSIKSENSNAWYYVTIKPEYNINDFEYVLGRKLRQSQISDLSSYLLFLSDNEVNKIFEFSYIYPAEKKNTLKNPNKETQKNKTYIVYADEHFSPPNFANTKIRFDNIFVVETSSPSSLFSDSRVFRIEKFPKFKILNRWATGFLQSGAEDIVLRDGYYTSNRVINDRGINGSDVIVTIIDTGASSTNCLFMDSNNDFPINTTNLNHRKIVRYDAFADESDEFNGHGTHCAGIVAGYPEDESNPLRIYAGHAPAAKLYISDTALDKDTREIALSLDNIQETINNSVQLSSHIISCSWGFDLSQNSNLLTYIFDEIVNSYPDILFVFAAGNDGGIYSINSPGESKNVLTVGAASPLRGVYLQNLESQIITITDNSSFSINVSSSNFYDILEETEIWSFTNLDTVRLREYEDFTDKLVILNEDELDFQSLINWTPNAILVIGKTTDVIPEDITFPAFYTDQFSSADEAIKKLKNVNITIDTQRPYGEIFVADYSSTGPTSTGVLKPDIIGPGTFIMSAGGNSAKQCNAKSALVQLSGTSMATPSIAGCAALVEQYLKEAHHGLIEVEKLESTPSMRMTAVLLKAMIISSGKQDYPTTNFGFGLPKLDNVLIEKDDPERGLRFAIGQIQSENEIIYTFITDNILSNADITLVYSDPAFLTDSNIPLACDIDLFVISPDGSIHYGNDNQNNQEESHSTFEKVTLNSPKVGKYEVHLKSMPFLSTVQSINYSIVITGPFAQKNFDNNPAVLLPNTNIEYSNDCSSNGKYDNHKCVCDSLHTGLHCQLPIQEVNEADKITQTLPSRGFYYMKLNLKNSNFLSLHFEKESQNTRFEISLNIDNEYKLSLSRYMFGTFSNKIQDLEIDLSQIQHNDYIYITLFNSAPITDTFTFKWTESSSNTFTTKMITTIFVAGVIIIAAIVIAAIVFIIIRRRKNRLNSNLNNTDITERTQYNDNNNDIQEQIKENLL